MSEQPQENCIVVHLSRKPKIFSGKFAASDAVGTYGKIKKPYSFAVPEEVDVKGFAVTPVGMPVFLVDPATMVAQPVGSAVVNDTGLPAKIEIAGQRRYVKALTMRIMDIVTLLIAMGCGAGLLFAVLTLLSTLSGKPIVFGAGS